ncbi:isoprenylcysteine carboxylmethyltransferase family protein [Rhodoferax sp.]|uniref:methyltransferase family protein n=1 Tax=Rhodoferax sp. TaxID=50421 RepID=UPI0027303C91|nr:isoprenylcysteine carboxylmethyltransferase family protein [Rhodoferax sp.]MDP1942981.1 isoprenylcysteine carboxylmethyltransferase family protein [Rhodoferax sp.]MDP3751955.1 isoprenylcysteine carboxylmethyltransferase family protein [Polaromonas sp.]
MNTLELKIPPPVLALGLALLMWLTSLFFAPWPMPFGFRLGAALALVAIGQGISISGILLFRRAGTPVNPFKPDAASSLVTNGVYRFTRNPMYVGLLLTLLGWAAFLSSPPAVLYLVVFVLYMNRFQIKLEERVLSSLFGGDYAAYQTRVRRWF